MATGSKVHLTASQQPEFYVKELTAESADKTSQLLQVNHEKHHIFFNQSGFHVSHTIIKHQDTNDKSNGLHRTTLLTIF
jgi:hypothetical protein